MQLLLEALRDYANPNIHLYHGDGSILEVSHV